MEESALNEHVCMCVRMHVCGCESAAHEMSAKKV